MEMLLLNARCTRKTITKSVKIDAPAKTYHTGIHKRKNVSIVPIKEKRKLIKMFANVIQIYTSTEPMENVNSVHSGKNRKQKITKSVLIVAPLNNLMTDTEINASTFTHSLMKVLNLLL